MTHLIYLLVPFALLVATQQCEAKFGFGFGSSKTTSEIVDSSKSVILTTIVGQLCNPKQQSSHVAKQLSRISTILWLNRELIGHLQYAQSLSTDQNNCLVDYLGPLHELAKIIEARRPDACSNSHISLIEAFHRKYIERRWQSSEGGQHPLPDPVKWFFIHYASELSEVCQRNFVANLELMAKNSQEAQYGTMFDGMSGKIIQAFQKLLKSPEHISRREDFVLIWSMIDRLSRKNLHKAGTDVIRMRLKARDPSSIRTAQQNCRVNLRPVYHETALSTMRLIDMGYYSVAGNRIDMSADGNYQNWYAIAQSCDFLLALEVYEDLSLTAKELVVISRDEANLLAKDTTLQSEPIKFDKAPASGWLAGDAVLQTVTSDEDPNKLMKLIKSNVKSRVKNFKRLLHKIVKSELKGNLKGLFMSRKSKDGKKFVKTPEPWAEEVLEATNDEGAVFATSSSYSSFNSYDSSRYDAYDTSSSKKSYDCASYTSDDCSRSTSDGSRTPDYASRYPGDDTTSYNSEITSSDISEESFHYVPNKLLNCDPVKPAELPLVKQSAALVEEPIEKPMNKPSIPAAEEPIKGPVELPVNHPVDKPADQPIDHHVDQPVEQPSDDLDENERARLTQSYLELDEESKDRLNEELRLQLQKLKSSSCRLVMPLQRTLSSSTSDDTSSFTSDDTSSITSDHSSSYDYHSSYHSEESFHYVPNKFLNCDTNQPPVDQPVDQAEDKQVDQSVDQAVEKPVEHTINKPLDHSLTTVFQKKESLLTRSWSQLDEETKAKFTEELRLQILKELQSASWRKDMLEHRRLSDLSPEELEQFTSEELMDLDYDHGLDRISNDVMNEDFMRVGGDKKKKPKGWKKWLKDSTRRHPFVWGTGVPVVILFIILIIVASFG